MNETIKLILSLSLSGSILAVLIFALKPLIRHELSKSIQYYIWIVVLLRFIIPFSFEGSIMNDVFYSSSPVEISSPGNIQLMPGAGENAKSSFILPNVRKNVTNGDYNGDVDHSRYFTDLLYQYALYLWLLGIIIAFTANLIGYVRFLKYLKPANKPATDEQNRVLTALLNGRNNVRLVRNRFVTTPMLIGILKPFIIIPDINFDGEQLKNILLHEVSHLRRFDIAVKWLTMLAASIHWFNPIMYFVKKEINHACELSCDEAIIKNFNPAEKQAYGNTLIAVVAEHKYPVGVLQATMCEEKETLTERLLAIMKYSKKSKAIMLMSIALVVAVISGAVMLGGYNGKINSKVSNEQEHIRDNFYQSINYDSGQDLLSFTIPKTIPEGYKFYLHVSGRMFMGDKSNGMSFHAFDEETQNYSWEEGKTYTYSLKSENLDECMLVFGLIDVNNQEFLYAIHISPDGTKRLDNTATSNLKINDLLSQIMSSPKESSNPADYIDAHKVEYELILKMDIEALPYLFSEFEKGGQTGLKGHIMENLCRNILGEEDIKYASQDPQDWYDTYKANIIRGLEENSSEFVKKNNPKGSIVLDLKSNYEVVNFADGQVEITGRKLAYKATNISPVHIKVGTSLDEQMMYRAVVFYEAVFARDLDTVNRMANERLNDQLKRWADNAPEKDDYSAMTIMKLDTYTGVAFPTGISAPKPHPEKSGKYMVALIISKDIEVEVYFDISSDGNPLVEGFTLVKGGIVQNIVPSY
ncbi:MAG: hypothetical protein CVU90_11450 [Firmicutes bacterium HGW-Firmicutes-15]|nr:MAG: hypothetical protein CVU90_11450 [Firmicutes bacterium HGW-Firmicutes-15]